MNNVIDKIKVSGITYDIRDSSAATESAFTAYTAATDTRISTDEEVTAAALNDLNEAVSGLSESVSGKQDTLIAGDYITIDTANTISTSGLVTVADNEVSGQSVSVSDTWFPSGYQPTPINGDSYATSFDIVEDSINGGEYGQQCNYNTDIIITLIDSSGNTVSGSVGNGYITAATPSDIIPSNMTSYLDAQITIQERHGYVKYSGKNGWRIKYISDVPLGGLTTFGIYTATRIDFPGGQSARVIENTVFPELKELSQALSGKQDTLVSGTNIKTINNESILGSGNIDIQGGSITVDTELDSGSTNPVQNKVIYNKFDEVEQVTAAGLNALNDKITPTVELTQAEYDALTVKDPNTYYIITDAEAGDLTNYYTKSETNTLLGGKQATLVSGTNIKTINNESILGSGNIDIQGGSTYTAGRGISIANDTISFSLPISAGTGTDSIVGGKGGGTQGNYSFVFGLNNTCGRNTIGTYIFGESNTVGYGCSYTSVGGYSNTATTAQGGHIEGMFNNITNNMECASGRYNVSNKASTTFGDSGNTLFSVGNGTSNSARHNAFEIRQNGDIYLTKDGQDVKLQDQLGGGGTVDQTIISGSTNAVAGGAVYNKIDEVEQVTAAGLNALNDNFGGLKLVKLTQAAYDALTVKDPNTLYIILG